MWLISMNYGPFWRDEYYPAKIIILLENGADYSALHGKFPFAGNIPTPIPSDSVISRIYYLARKGVTDVELTYNKR
jgi:hypothetical protein